MRMPKELSEDVSRVIVQALTRGLTRDQISGVVGVSKRAITRISTNLKRHGTPKAPKSGVKLGRPARMTRRQAEAMLQWIAERKHIFYVKDLMVFLQENHGYSGCDGTVRRCMLRAGYRRKLPWHKSEITTWIPPEHPPELTTVLEDDDGDEAIPDAPSSETLTSGHIDPALVGGQASQARAENCASPVEAGESAALISQLLEAAAKDTEQHSTPSLQEPAERLAETARSPVLTEQNAPVASMQATPSASVRQQEPVRTPAKKTKRVQNPDAVIDPALDVAELQDTLRKQREIIEQLQRQLAQAAAATSIQGPGASVARHRNAKENDGVDMRDESDDGGVDVV